MTQYNSEGKLSAESTIMILNFLCTRVNESVSSAIDLALALACEVYFVSPTYHAGILEEYLRKDPVKAPIPPPISGFPGEE